MFRNNLKLIDAEDCANCFYRLEVDTYGRGCAHDCAWCYAKSYLSIRRYWNEPQPFPIDITETRKLFHHIFETDKPSPWRELFERRVSLRIGGMSDAFMWMDKRLGVTREFMKILDFYEYPAWISTRSDLVAHDEYLDVMNPDRVVVQMSISSIRDNLTKAIEPGRPRQPSASPR